MQLKSARSTLCKPEIICIIALGCTEAFSSDQHPIKSLVVFLPTTRRDALFYRRPRFPLRRKATAAAKKSNKRVLRTQTLTK